MGFTRRLLGFYVGSMLCFMFGSISLFCLGPMCEFTLFLLGFDVGFILFFYLVSVLGFIWVLCVFHVRSMWVLLVFVGSYFGF